MKPLSVVVRTVCDVFAWFLVVFGAYVIIHGHLTPGGGFQGGAVVATFLALLLVAHGGKKVLDWASKKLFEGLETTGLLVFIGAGFLGISTSFFFNVLAGKGGLFGATVPLGANDGILQSSGTIALMNLAVGFEVVGGLSIILLAMFAGIRLLDNLSGEERGHDR